MVTFTTPPSDDTTPPSVPGSLRSTGVTANSVSLAWNASTDNGGTIAGYDVFQGATKVATTTSLGTTVTNLSPNTSYTFTVKARDPDGNSSAASNAVTAKTAATGNGGIPEYDKDITKVDLGWSVDFLPNGNALVTERDRFEILLVTPSGQKTTLGKVPGAVGTNGEGGLLGLAISPNWPSDHAIYLYHTASGDNRIVKMTYDGTTLSSTSTPVLTGIAKNRYHNGGRIKFGPDGKLYATVGDAKNSDNAQNKSSLNGKILRLNADGSAPSDNPFYATGGNARYVCSYGHRNPQGLAWDSRGQLWAAEFGESSQDELNLIQKGGNFGWPSCEGTQGSCSGFIAPKKTWSTSQAGPSGLEIVNDWIYIAGVTGEQMFATQINAAGTGVGTVSTLFSGRWGRLRSVTKTPDGGLWLTSTNNDKNGGTPSTLDNVIVRLKFPGGATPGDFKLTSSAFADNATIPDKYTCAGDGTAGQDPSPPLAWGARGRREGLRRRVRRHRERRQQAALGHLGRPGGGSRAAGGARRGVHRAEPGWREAEGHGQRRERAEVLRPLPGRVQPPVFVHALRAEHRDGPRPELVLDDGPDRNRDQGRVDGHGEAARQVQRGGLEAAAGVTGAAPVTPAALFP